MTDSATTPITLLLTHNKGKSKVGTDLNRIHLKNLHQTGRSFHLTTLVVVRQDVFDVHPQVEAGFSVGNKG